MIRQERQCEQVLEYLKSHDSITQRDADKLGIKRLASRICDLKKMNVNIESKLIPVTNADGSVSHVGSYSLKGETWQAKKQEDTSVSSNQTQMPTGTVSATEIPATDVPTGKEKCGQEKTMTTTTETECDNRFTWELCSEIVMKLKKATQQQKDNAVLYMFFSDYTRMKEMCPREFQRNDLFLGIEIKPSFKCPQGQYYIIRR